MMTTWPTTKPSETPTAVRASLPKHTSSQARYLRCLSLRTIGTPLESVRYLACLSLKRTGTPLQGDRYLNHQRSRRRPAQEAQSRRHHHQAGKQLRRNHPPIALHQIPKQRNQQCPQLNRKKHVLERGLLNHTQQRHRSHHRYHHQTSRTPTMPRKSRVPDHSLPRQGKSCQRFRREDKTSEGRIKKHATIAG